MTVQHLDDHLSPEDRDSAALLRRRAEGMEPSPGPDLAEVVSTGRRHVRRRRAAALGAAVVVGLAAAAAVQAAAPPRALPAAPAPEVTVVPVERSASGLYERVADAVADAGVVPDEDLRWRSQRKIEDGVLWSGFTTSAYVPATGASLAVTSLRREESASGQPGDEAACEVLVGSYRAAGEDVVCEESEVPGGRLVTLTVDDWTAVSLSTPSTRVHVESDVDTLGSGPQLQSPAALPVETLVDLATDPRLRW